MFLVSRDDPRLVDRTGGRKLATTDQGTRLVCISEDVGPDLLQNVLIHEACHCAMVSYGLLPNLHAIVAREDAIGIEEWACQFVANYGKQIISAADNVRR